MDEKQEASSGETRDRVVQAVTELAKGIKIVSFYPPGHPALNQAVGKIISSIEAVPPPEAGIEIDVTKNALLYREEPLPSNNKAITDFNRELYHRRASKIILLPGQMPQEMISFLSALNRDIQELHEQGGLEKVLLREKVHRIWVNRVDYEGLTRLLKEEEIPEPQDEEARFTAEGLSLDPESTPLAELDIGELLKRLEQETDSAGYRDLVIAVTHTLLQEGEDLRITHSEAALSIYVKHIEKPPGNNPEIAALASTGVREIVSDDLVDHYIRRLQERRGRIRAEVERILIAFGERAVKVLLSALAEERDILMRKLLIDILVKIGRPAVPAVIDNLNDSRWYVVRNMVSILGSLDSPDLAPRIAEALAHPDLRVKKEAIRGLSKLSHPDAVAALGKLCFFPEETVALSATAALSLKKEDEAVRVLLRRATQRKVFFPHYRLGHEAIESLRAIDTEEAISALEEILRAKAIWETSNFRELKKHALRCISRMSGERPREIVLRARGGPETYLRVESERIVKRTGW